MINNIFGHGMFVFSKAKAGRQDMGFEIYSLMRCRSHMKNSYHTEEE